MRTLAHNRKGNVLPSWKGNILSGRPRLATPAQPASPPLTSPEDASRHTPSAPDPPSTAYTVAWSTAAHAPASPGSPADPHPPPACASQTHAAAYVDAHPPPAPG